MLLPWEVKNKIKDAIGDIFVTLVIQSEMHGFSLNECVAKAWNEIKNRKGQMIDGQFVKDEGVSGDDR